jgi:hypothetical protein
MLITIPRRAGIVAFATLGALVVTSCSSDDVAERLIESQSGGDVDVDLDGGNVRIQTPEGELQITTDENGNSVIRTEDGEAVVAQGDDGEVVIQSEDGTSTFGGGQEIPQDYPVDQVPLPDGLVITYGSRTDASGQLAYGVTGEIAGATGAEVWAAYKPRLEAAGFASESETVANTDVFVQGTAGKWTVIISATGSGDGENAFVTVQAVSESG